MIKFILIVAFSAKVLTLITRHSIQHFQLLSKVRAGGRPKGASVDFRSSPLQINILLCWQIWTNTIHLQSRVIAVGVEWTLDLSLMCNLSGQLVIYLRLSGGGWVGRLWSGPQKAAEAVEFWAGFNRFVIHTWTFRRRRKTLDLEWCDVPWRNWIKEKGVW